MKEGKPILAGFASFTNEPLADFSREEDRQAMAQALNELNERLGKTYPIIIGGKEVRTSRELLSLNPTRPEEVVGRTFLAGQEEAKRAIAAAREAFARWRLVPGEQRAQLLFKTAEVLRGRRFQLAALEVKEVSKNWREADADVKEAIDYCRYYAEEMIRLAQPQKMGSIPGETNLYIYVPRGVVAVIAPWNFPLGISAGMVSAAVVTGNCVVYKPAEQSPITGAEMVAAFQEAGVPDGVVNFLPGIGEEVGQYLVKHKDVSMIAFTGSKEVGLKIIEAAARVAPGQQEIKKVVAEMGGKNAIIVDQDADLDEAVLGVLHSAFGYQGQKCSACSRAIVHQDIYERFLQRLVAATKSLRIGTPEDPGVFLGAVIDQQALEKIHSYIELGRKEARLVTQQEPPEGGYFVGPTIFADVSPASPLALEEIFGPVLAVIKASDFEEALRLANASEYALTGGLFSRSPAHIAQACQEFQVGNLYINRRITGALVDRQPFGGFKMSGIGSKAGGPDYLLQFMIPRTITENTLHRGFAPKEN